MRIRTAHLALLLPLSLAACGDDRVSATTTNTTSSTTSMSGEGSGSSTQADSESETGSGSETGEPANVCESCSEDELCVAHADDACNATFGYTLECVPEVAACADGECDPDCLAALCGNSFCAPPCGQVPGVDVWCSGPTSTQCDPLLQDCVDGEKCVAYASQGGNWDDTKCVPITGDNMVGEACMSSGVVESTDDCDENGMCFAFDDEGLGTCYGFCGVGESCPDAQTCLVANDESIALCLDSCVPHHSQNCAAGTACVPINEVFMCLPVPTLPPDSICGLGDYCALGQACVSASELDSCAGESCCTDWCDTIEPDPCTLPLSCQPYWPQGQAPAGLETAGVCKLG